MKLSAADYRAMQKPKAPTAKWGKTGPTESQQQAGAVRLNIKPLSVNGAWKGVRYKTDDYKRYELAVLLMLPKMELPQPPFKLTLVFGFSNYGADLDNPCKCLTDILSKKYGFNDKHITELHIRKEIVPKGQEFIDFNITTAPSE